MHGSSSSIIMLQYGIKKIIMTITVRSDLGSIVESFVK